jgi:hypothetical protein
LLSQRAARTLHLFAKTRQRLLHGARRLPH